MNCTFTDPESFSALRYVMFLDFTDFWPSLYFLFTVKFGYIELLPSRGSFLNLNWK